MRGSSSLIGRPLVTSTEPGPAAGRPGTPRLQQVDIARGLAVIGVVLNHAVDGLIGAAIVPSTSTLARFNDALYVFRMPTLALLLGLFIPLGVRRRGLGAYVRQRTVLFGYLYVVWFVLQSATEALTSGLRNSQSHALSLLTVWRPSATCGSSLSSSSRAPSWLVWHRGVAER